MDNFCSRTKRLIGETAVNELSQKRVAVFGLGGVGGFAAEALARAGVGHLSLIDFDTIDVTNINRQIIALKSTIGKKKIDVFKERLLDINENIDIFTIDAFVSEDTDELIEFSKYDYIVDAIDYVKGKIKIIELANKNEVAIISAMGMGNKLDPHKIEVKDISKTSVCPLAKTVRKELKKRNIKDVKAVFSKEEPIKRIAPPGSISFVPSVAGLIIAKEVILDMIDLERKV